MKNRVVLMAVLLGFSTFAHASCERGETTGYHLKNGKATPMEITVRECSAMDTASVDVEFGNQAFFYGSYTMQQDWRMTLNNEKAISVATPKQLPQNYECVTNKTLKRKKEAYCYVSLFLQ